MRHLTLTNLATCAFLLSISGCTLYPSFGFPIEEGDIEAGQQAFIDHQCHTCHTVVGVRLPALTGNQAPMLELGGETSQVKAYSELVTSIINPEHRISERYWQRWGQLTSSGGSPMSLRHLDTMTIRELIDVVAFLDSRYVFVGDYQPISSQDQNILDGDYVPDADSDRTL